ncbi:MAG: 2-hydroxyacid dehydrogenase [Spirochaetales bacterium]
MENTKPVSVAFFDSKPYDIHFFTQANRDYLYTIDFLEPRLNAKTALLAKDYDVVCAFVNDKLDKKTVDVLYDMGIKLIALRCAGFNNVDLSATQGRISVVRVPAYSPHSVAEYSAALLFSLTRKIPLAFNRTRDGNFQLQGLTGRDLNGRTCGIIGTGKIGKLMAGIMKGCGMNVLAFDTYPDEQWACTNNITYAPLDDLFTQSDVISLHCPLTTDTHYIINEKALNIMKNDAVIINTGRGALIDAKALIEALKNKQIGGAALDVYEEEDGYFFEDWSTEVIQDDVLARLLVMPNVIISGHQAFFTEEALSAIAKTTLENIKSFNAGQPLVNEVKK